MQKTDIANTLKATSYPGRGILIGCSEDGKSVVTAYFIMGRSVNSRNRIFAEEGEGIRTQAFDESKLSDPSLIIYAPVRVLGNTTIVTNGDQTDTVYDLMAEGKTFEEALRTREFEPDDPNYTPRISGIINVADGKYDFAMSILKSDDGNPELLIRAVRQGKRGSSILTWKTPTRCQALKENRKRWPSQGISTRSRTPSGTASTRITRCLSSSATSTSRRANTRRAL